VKSRAIARPRDKEFGSMARKEESQNMAVPPHLRLRSGELKAAATDAVARGINDDRIEAREKKTARLKALREAKEEKERAEAAANPPPAKTKKKRSR
jgi:hypothetical protein